MLRLTPWPLAAILLLAGCDREPDFHHERLLVFGTVVEISLYGTSPDSAETIMDDLEQRLTQRHDQWHAWEDSALTRFNAELRERGEAIIPAELRPLMETGLTMAERTGYAMDPGIGALVEAWGFHGDTLDHDAAPPADHFIAGWRERPHSAANLHREEDRIRLTQRDLQLDFGAVAKGIALAELRKMLHGQAIDAGIINAGGDLTTLGQPGDRDWRIGIRNPGGQDMIGTLAVADGESVFTSGVYERGFEHEGTWYHHVLDPATGMPTQGLEAVTVIHDDPALADAAATALLIAGPDHWDSLARELGLRRVLVIEPDNTITATAAMAERLELSPDSGATLQLAREQ